MAARRRLPLPRVALRLAGLAARVAVDLLGRDRVHAGLAGDRRDGTALAPRRAERLRLALHVPRRAGVVARPHLGLGSSEADRRARDDGGDLPRLRAGALRRLAPVGDRGRDRGGRRAAARLCAVPARGAARLPVLDDRVVGDHRRDRESHPRPARARRRPLPRGAVRPRRAGGAAGRLRRRPLLPPLADRELQALALDLERRRLGGSSDARRRRRGRLQRGGRAPEQRLVRGDRLREAARLRPRRLVARGDDDRTRGAADRGDGRRLRLPPPPRHRRRAARSSSSESRRALPSSPTPR